MSLQCVIRVGMSIVAGIVFPFGITAQTVKDTLTDKVYSIDEVLVKSRKLSNAISSPQPIQTINRGQLDALGIQSVADAVKRFAGVTVRDYGGIGGLKTVSVRSFGSSHTAICYDGVTVSNCQAGQIDIGRFSLDNVEELSLAIGQESDMLQPARNSASAGVLSIRTERPSFSQGKNDAWRVQLRGGSFGYITPTLRYARQLGERTVCMVEANYMRADGVYPFRLTNGKKVTTERRLNSDIVSYQVESNLYHTFCDNSQLSFKTYFYDSERGLPGAIILYNSDAQLRQRLWDENFFSQLTYDKRFNLQWALRTSAKYSHTWNRYEDKDISYGEAGKLTDINRQDEYYLSVSALYKPCRYWDISLAQDGAINTLHSNLPRSPLPTRYTSLTSLNMRYILSWITVQGTLLGTFITEEVKRESAPDDRHRLSPSLSFTIRPWQSERLFLRFFYKNTFRVPTFNDMYYFRVGNTELLPEKATEYNIGMTYDRSSLGFLDYLTFTIDGYINRVDDKIVAFPALYVWKMANYGRVHITGLDCTLGTGVSLCSDIELHLTGNYTYQRAVNRTDRSSKTYGHQLPYTPKHTATVGSQLRLPWFTMGYSLMAVGTRYCAAQNIETYKMDAFTEHTLTLLRDFSLGGIDWHVQAEAVNFTNTQYEVVKYYPMPGRSYRLTAQMIF